MKQASHVNKGLQQKDSNNRQIRQNRSTTWQSNQEHMTPTAYTTIDRHTKTFQHASSNRRRMSATERERGKNDESEYVQNGQLDPTAPANKRALNDSDDFITL